ncbi:TPA: DMT family transporter [Bacillus cereus]|nr:DMT family transporter [Bacillus cereus]
MVLILSAFLSSINQVFYAKWVQDIDPFVYSFLSFSITLLFFLSLTVLKSIKVKKSNIKLNNKRAGMNSIVVLNIITAIIFICFYYANKYIEPAIVSAIEIGIGPIIALVLSLIIQKINILKFDIYVCLGILIGTLILVWASLSGKSGIASDTSFTYKGLLATFTAGIGMVLATIYSKKLSQAGWSTYEILAHRFYMLVPVTIVFVLNKKASYILDVFQSNWNWIIVFTFLGLIIPLYLIQVGIKYCNPLFVSVTLTLGPVFTFVFQLLDPRVKWSWISLSGIGCLCVFVIIKMFIQNVGLNKEKTKGEKLKHA